MLSSYYSSLLYVQFYSSELTYKRISVVMQKKYNANFSCDAKEVCKRSMQK